MKNEDLNNFLFSNPLKHKEKNLMENLNLIRSNSLKSLKKNSIISENLIHKNEVQNLIEIIPYPTEDLSLTSFSSSSLSPRINNSKNQIFIDSKLIGKIPQNLETLTPNRLNKIMNWSKNHITPGDNKNIFPQVIAPSMEFSQDNLKFERAATFGGEEDNNLISNNLNINNLNNNIPQQIHQKEHLYNNNNNNEYLNSKVRIENCKLSKEIIDYQNESIFQNEIIKKLENEKNELIEKYQELKEKLQFIGEINNGYSIEELRGKGMQNAVIQIKQLKVLLEKKNCQLNDLNLVFQKEKRSEMIKEEAMHEEIKNLNDEIKKNQIICMSYKKKVNYYENYVNDLKNEINNLEKKNIEIFKEKNSFNKELEKMDGFINKQNDLISEMERRIEEKDMNEKKIMEEIEFHKKRADLYQENHIDQEQNNFVDNLWKNKENENKKYQEEIQRLRRENESLKFKISQQKYQL